MAGRARGPPPTRRRCRRRLAEPVAALLRAPTAGSDGAGLVLSTPGVAQVVAELVAARIGAAHVAVSNGAPRRSLFERVLTRFVAPHLDGVVVIDRVHVPRLVESGYLPTRIRTVPPDSSSAEEPAGDPRLAQPPTRPGDREPRRAAVDEYAAHVLSFVGEPVASPSRTAQAIEESTRLPAHRLLRHWNSVFSRGVGYETTPPGRAYEGDRVAGYYIDFRGRPSRLRRGRRRSSSPQGSRSSRWGGGSAASTGSPRRARSSSAPAGC